MTQVKPTFSPLSSNAYRIFVAELPQQLKRAEEVLEANIGVNPQQAKSLAAAFHTIKGGAGFFGLEQVYRLAGDLEKLLLNFTPQELAGAKALFASFKHHAAEIPEPKKP